MTADKSIREHLLEQLLGGSAHLKFDQAVAGFPEEMMGVRIKNAPYTAWQLLEHMRIAQWDILEFSRNPRHVSPDFPGGYWPKSDAPPDRAAWDASVESFRRDLREIERLIGDPSTDLFAVIPHGTGQTIFRESLLVADHNAYHLGQLVLLRRLLGVWKD
jgi:hypothetical protein